MMFMVRITPACAGKTIGRPFTRPTYMDHPRMRGEDALEKLSGDISAGSPPHARGRHLKEAKGRILTRITPACAGKTPAMTLPCPTISDHPRMRGEDQREFVGSPPHARGRLCHERLNVRAIRITPACAGKTAAYDSKSSSAWDHPRMRGEDTARIPANTPATGSPPHARGRLVIPRIVCHAYRITPACAGKTHHVTLFT